MLGGASRSRLASCQAPVRQETGQKPKPSCIVIYVFFKACQQIKKSGNTMKLITRENWNQMMFDCPARDS